MIITRSDIRGERAERIEGGLVAPLDLLFHVFVYHVHGYVTWSLVHNLATAFPSSFG